MKLTNAAHLGISRVRKAYWADPRDHVELVLIGRGYAPWATLHSPLMAEINMPECEHQKLLVIGDDAADWLPFEPEKQIAELERDIAKLRSYLEALP